MNKNIFSPMASGNGAYIVHSALSRHIPNYSLESIPAIKTIFPLLLHPYKKSANIVHTVPEYGDVFFSDCSKSVVTFHNFFWDAEYRRFCSLSQRCFYYFLQKGYVKRAVDQADVVVAVSEFTANLVRQAFPGLTVKVILNGVDTDRFVPLSLPNRKTVNVLFSGNPTRRKGRHVLRQVAEKLPENVYLLITGGLRGQAKELDHPKIKFVGHVPYENMPELYQKSDILLLPSYREGLSLSALEAMASGLPVVCYDTSSMAELIVDGEGGGLSEPDRLADLICNLNSLLTNPSDLKRMGEFNRHRCEEFYSENRMCSEYEQVFEGLL